MINIFLNRIIRAIKIDIELFEEGGWHFNNILTAKEISLKLRTFAHIEFSGSEYSDEQIIAKKIEDKIDLFNRGHRYKIVNFDNSFPKYLRDNIEKYKKFLLI